MKIVHHHANGHFDWLISGHHSVRLQLHGAIYRPDSFVLTLCYCANLKAIRYESTSLKRIVADKSQRVIVALIFREREFLYCRTNTKDLRLSILWFDVRIAFPSRLTRSYLDFLLSFDYPLRVLIPFKVIAKASRTSGS